MLAVAATCGLLIEKTTRSVKNDELRKKRRMQLINSRYLKVMRIACDDDDELNV